MSEPVAPPDLGVFAVERHLDPRILADTWHVRAVMHNGRPALRFPTCLGVDRVKYTDRVKPKATWVGAGGSAHCYGLGEAQRIGGEVLNIVNGEPSVWAAAQAEVPAVCFCVGEDTLPSAEVLAELRGSGFKRFAVIYDRDDTGRRGARGVVATLFTAELEAVALELPADLGEGGDVDDLHRRVGRELGPALARLPELREPSPPGLIRCWEQSEPAPMRHVVEGLVFDCYPASLYGDGGLGKSYLAVLMSSCVAMGLPFLGRETLQGPVLYLDAELEHDEFHRRAFRVARGLGLEKPPVGLHYFRLTDSLARAETFEAVEELVSFTKPILIAVDSLTAAAFGADVNEASAVTTLMKAIEGWGPSSLCVDHIPKAQAGVGQTNTRPFGSTFKFNLARSAMHLVKAEGGGSLLRQTKTNFSRLSEPLAFAVDFSDPRMVRFTGIGLGDDRLVGVENNLSALDRAHRILALAGETGLAPDALAGELGIAVGTAKNYLTTLRRLHRAEPGEGGRWRAADLSHNVTLPSEYDDVTAPDPDGWGEVT